MKVLGIETSCDETAAAVVERNVDGAGQILSNVVRSQLEEHAPFGGVVPELAARSHVTHLDRIISQALAESTSCNGRSAPQPAGWPSSSATSSAPAGAA